MFKLLNPETYSEKHFSITARRVAVSVAIIQVSLCGLRFMTESRLMADLTMVAVTAFALLVVIVMFCDARREARNKTSHVSVNDELSIFNQDWKAPLGEPCVFD